MVGRVIDICPKCGSVDCGFIENGHMKCNACGKTARRKFFRGGGPKPPHKTDRADAPSRTMENGALWRMPVRYDDD